MASAGSRAARNSSTCSRPTRRTHRRLLADYVRRLPEARRRGAEFYEVQDICGRIAGCGSLGRFRFTILVAGHGEEDAKNVLLEFKEALPSGLDLMRRTPANQLTDCRAAEVTGAAQAMQHVSNRYLGYAIDGEASFQVREIGPCERRLEWKIVKHADEYDDVAALHSQLLARAHARAALATLQTRKVFAELAAVLRGRTTALVEAVSGFASAYAKLVEADHATFVARQAEVVRAFELPTV